MQRWPLRPFCCQRPKEKFWRRESEALTFSPPLRGCCKTRKNAPSRTASAKADAYQRLIPCRRRLQPAPPRNEIFSFATASSEEGKTNRLRTHTLAAKTRTL